MTDVVKRLTFFSLHLRDGSRCLFFFSPISPLLMGPPLPKVLLQQISFLQGIFLNLAIPPQTQSCLLFSFFLPCFSSLSREPCIGLGLLRHRFPLRCSLSPWPRVQTLFFPLPPSDRVKGPHSLPLPNPKFAPFSHPKLAFPKGVGLLLSSCAFLSPSPVHINGHLYHLGLFCNRARPTHGLHPLNLQFFNLTSKLPDLDTIYFSGSDHLGQPPMVYSLSST